LAALVEMMNPKDVEYDVISGIQKCHYLGISIGSINGAGISLYKIGEEDQASEFLVNFWDELRAHDVYKEWDFGILEGLVKPGLFNNWVFRDHVKSWVGPRNLERRVSVGTLNANNGIDYL
jgi:predicted acylesterase/phospholipase RssA